MSSREREKKKTTSDASIAMILINIEYSAPVGLVLSIDQVKRISDMKLEKKTLSIFPRQRREKE